MLCVAVIWYCFCAGEPELREIASGIRAHYRGAADLEGRKVAVVCNLKVAKLAGFPSNGMVLCAEAADQSLVAVCPTWPRRPCPPPLPELLIHCCSERCSLPRQLVEPPEASEPGERIFSDGMVDAPASPNQVKKKKLLEACIGDLKAIDHVATYRGVPLATAAGACTTPTVANGVIR